MSSKTPIIRQALGAVALSTLAGCVTTGPQAPDAPPSPTVGQRLDSAIDWIGNKTGELVNSGKQAIGSGTQAATTGINSFAKPKEINDRSVPGQSFRQGDQVCSTIGTASIIEAGPEKKSQPVYTGIKGCMTELLAKDAADVQRAIGTLAKPVPGATEPAILSRLGASTASFAYGATETTAQPMTANVDYKTCKYTFTAAVRGSATSVGSAAKVEQFCEFANVPAIITTPAAAAAPATAAAPAASQPPLPQSKPLPAGIKPAP